MTNHDYAPLSLGEHIVWLLIAASITGTVATALVLNIANALTGATQISGWMWCVGGALGVAAWTPQVIHAVKGLSSLARGRRADLRNA